MHRIVLDNGLTILWYQRPSKTVTLEVCVRVGSNYEPSSVRGISHFIEHMLFEGTAKRPSAMRISNEIERIGGEFNAATTFDRTLYYATVLQKHFDIALDVVSDMMMHPLFAEALIEKERKVILDEIHLVTDDPRNHQWVLFHQALFQRHPCRNPVYGSVATVKQIKRHHIIDYFQKYYLSPRTMVIIVGDMPGGIAKVQRTFSQLRRGDPTDIHDMHCIEPLLQKPRIKKEKKTLLHSYTVYGFRTVHRSHPDSYVLDVIRAHLGRGQSGKLFDEIRTKRGLAYDVGVYHNSSSDLGYLAVYFGTDKKNIKTIISLINHELKNSSLGKTELLDAQNFIEGDFLLQNEDNAHCADALAAWETLGSAQGFFEYVQRIQKVTLADIRRVVQKYFTQPYAMACIEQK